MENITHTYFYFFIFFIIALVTGLVFLKCAFFIARFLFQDKNEKVLKEGYAGGFFLLSPVITHFSLRFAFLSLLFVLFVVEILLLLLWAISLNLSQGQGIFIAISVFVLWGIGYFYEYKKGALEWR